MSPAGYVFNWKTAAFILAFINIKSLPFAWHIRLLYRFCKNWYHPNRVRRTIKEAAEKGHVHPIFQTESIFSHTSAYETDYNLHKSNSTYFSDLDESRTFLVTKLFGPALRSDDNQLEKEGHTGRINVILGSVHTSFHKEIKPYERYEIRSRVLGWDQKWLVIASWFIRPAKKGKAEVLLGSALSKYVVKKGRFTVSPERCLKKAGWLPSPPTGSQGGAGEKQDSSEESNGQISSSATPTKVDTPRQDEADGIAAPVPESAIKSAEVVQRLESAAARVTKDDTEMLDAAQAPRAVEWDWHRIEMERLRGLQIVADWLGLDKDLMGEFSHDLNTAPNS